MKAVVQRVKYADIKVNEKLISEIAYGMLILLGIANEDNLEDINWLVKKLINLRIFDDENGVMNRSVKDINGEILVISQFTLMASTKKGNRPSYVKAAPPETAIPLYNQFIEKIQQEFGKQIKTGQFGADMKVSLLNDGPVTILFDTKNK